VILIDTSVWIDHLRVRDETLSRLLRNGDVLMHPFIIGELALGYLKQRDMLLGEWSKLPSAEMATHAEVIRLVGEQKLFGLGLGYVDAHILAALRLTPSSLLWTRDKRLSEVAGGLNISRFFPRH
jgi:predicted nucleic acid-binding protein